MNSAPLPENEASRLAELQKAQILDTQAEEAYDDLVQLAAYICGTPIALISLIDAHRQWFKAKVGVEAPETPRAIAFCAHAIRQSTVFIVPDASRDSRFADNLLVTSDPHIRFYAGMPLVTASGHALGTLCVIDREPRELTPLQVDALRRLGQQAIKLIELRIHVQERSRLLAQMEASQRLLDGIVTHLPAIVFVKEAASLRYTLFNQAAADLVGLPREAFVGKTDYDFFPKEDADFFTTKDREVLANRVMADVPAEPIHTKTKGVRTLHTKKIPLFGRDGAPEYLLGLSEDITDQQRQETSENIQHAVGQVLAEAGSWLEARPRLLRAIGECLQWKVGLYWEPASGGRVLECRETWSDESPAYAGFIALSRGMAFTQGVGLPGRIWGLKEAQGIADLAQERTFPRRQAAEQAGLHSACAVPLMIGGSVFGIMEFFCQRLGVVDDRLLASIQTAGTAIEQFIARIQAQEQTARLFLQNRLILDSVSEGLCGVSMDGMVTFLNPAGVRLLGYSVEELVGTPLHATLHHTRTDGTACLPDACPMRDTLRSGTPHHVADDLLWCKDGSPLPVEYSSAPILDEAGRVTGTVLTFKDITVQKRENAQRQEQELRLRAVVDHAVDGIITINDQGLIESFNPAAARLFGFDVAEVLGQNVKLLMPEPYQSEHDGYLANYRQTGAAKIIGIGREVIGRRKDGSTFPLELGVSELRLGERRLFTGIVRDITERKIAGMKLEQAALEMERRNVELAEAHDQALEATKAKSAFLASMSHEIRTPMNAIIGMADLLQETTLSQDQQEYVQRFSRAANSLLNLINDILDISKIEAGHMELETVPFDLHDLVDKTVELMAIRANAKKLELLAFVHPDVPHFVSGDPTRLRQVCVNLLGNAIKFTERGEVALRIERDASAPDALRFSVSDTGIGIPAEKLKGVFDNFTQVDSTTTRKYGGTGLGLSISKQLVELMGGQIGVESTPKLGSTFFFVVRLPVTAAVTPEPALTLELQGQRMLIVDDNDTNRLIVREHLSRFGAQLVEANCGTAALAALDEAQRQGAPFHLAILDYHMPDMNGLDLAQIIRGRPDTASLPLVMHTSNMGSEAAKQAREIGIVSYVYKPISRKRLLASVAIGLGQAPAAPMPKEPDPVSAKPTELPPLHILLVEDLEDNREVIKLFLKDLPYQLEMAENGAIAVQKFQAGRYDLVLMDMQMPVMDGYQATAEIRQWEQAQHRVPTPIVSLTANVFRDEIEKSLASGCTAHLTKPIKKKTLLVAIAEHATRTP